jgi:hypothetical protein
MPHNSTDMIHNARQEFDHLLGYLRGQADRGATAYQVECSLFTHLLALGRMLLGLFFALCAERSARQGVHDEAGHRLALHSWKARRLVSIFGEIDLERPYFWQPGASGHTPMDEAVSLPEDGYSDLLREHVELLATKMAYEQACLVLEHVLGVGLSTSSVARLVGGDATDVEAFYEQQAPPAPSQEAEVLVVQADGKGVPMRPSESGPKASPRQQHKVPVRLGKGQKRTKKKEAVVTSLYTAARRVRSADDVIASFFNEAKHTDEPAGAVGRRPQGKKRWATLEGKEAAFRRLCEQAQRRDGAHIVDRVALSDGCVALQDRFREAFPRFTLVLDFVHVSEYLWKAANALLGEADAGRAAWVKTQTRALLSSEHGPVVEVLEQASQREQDVPAQVARYFRRNVEAMDYARYLARGWPIASGVIEGACRHLVKDRCEASGMRWSRAGAEHLLALRAVEVNGDWEAYHRYRRQERHLRLYGRSLEEVEPLEEQTLRLAA